MICYQDRTFCVSPNCINACGRKLTPAIRANAAKWWGTGGAPIAVGWFCGEDPTRTNTDTETRLIIPPVEALDPPDPELAAER